MAKTAPVRQKRITIDRFLGVDFANAETEVDTRRSPWAPNMVADKAGYPEKRPGYTCLQSYPGPVHGMGFFQGNMLVHAGTKLYGPEKTILYSDMAERRSSLFSLGGQALYSGREPLSGIRRSSGKGSGRIYPDNGNRPGTLGRRDAL